jgi:hypothetical protein
MSVFTKLGVTIAAPVDERGDPRQPIPQDFQVWMTEVERLLGLSVLSGASVYETLAGLAGDLAKPANALAWVVNDPVASNNGLYGKVGPAGSGSWSRRANLPYSFIIASDAGAGTPNAIQASTSLPVSSGSLIWMNVAKTTTGSATVSFNGGNPLTIKSNSGNDIAAGGLAAGMVALGIISGANFRLVSDQASAVLVAAAEVSALQAKGYRDQALAAAAGVTLPSAAASTYLRQKADLSGYETRTAAQTADDLNQAAVQLGGVGSRSRSAYDRFGDTFDVEEFLIGDGLADNSASLAALISFMTAYPKKVYRSKPGRVFRVFSGGFVFPDNITLNTEGAKFQLAISLSASATPLITGANNRIDALIWEVLAGVTFSRGVAVKDGSRIGTLQLTSVDQQANNGALFNAGLRLDGSNIEIQEAIVANVDNAFTVYADGASGVRESISVKSLRVTNYLRGMYARNVRGFSLSDFIIKGRSPNARPDPGHNGILLEGGEFTRITNGSVRDSGEHGVRSGGFRDASAGTGSYITRTRQLTIGEVQIENAGQSGLKVWSGAAAQQHRDVNINSVQCIDCGDDGDGLGFNDTGFMLQNIDGLSISNCSISSRNRTFAAYDGYILQGISNGSVTGCRSANVVRNGMRLSEYSDDLSLDPLPLQYVDVSAFQSFASGGSGMYLNFPGSSAIRDLMVSNAHIIQCTNGFEAIAAAGRFVQQCYVSALVRGNTGSKFSTTTTANLKTVDLAA